jgi:hypothetical protein
VTESNPRSERDRNDNASGCLAFPLSIKKSTTSQEVICLMDALRLSVQLTDQKRCFFISLPALLWDANMTPHRGDEGEARECVCS